MNKPQSKKLHRLDYKPLPYKIDDVYLEFILDKANTVVNSKLTLRPIDASQDLQLNGENLTLHSLAINGQSLDQGQYNLEQKDNGQQLLTIPSKIFASQQLDDTGHYLLEISVNNKPQDNKTLQGLYFVDELFSTQCESAGFRAITFFIDRPDNSSIYTTKIIASQDMQYLLSNGNKVEEGKLAEGQHFSVWHDPHPKPCYLFALVAGNFDKVEDYYITKSGRKVKFEIFVERGKGSQAEFAMQALHRSFKWDEVRFDLEYDLDIFMIVAVPSFNMGAMENKGLNIFNDKYILGNKDVAIDLTLFHIDSIIAHEYFHNWTGDRVTCRDWFQLTLKEGLTVFRDQEYSGDHFDPIVNRISNVKILRNNQFIEDASPNSHPIRPNEIVATDNLYTATVYEKGAEIIRMIHTLLGEEKFQQGMKLYFARHDGDAATCEDFCRAMQDASGIDLFTHFFKWYSQSGTPIVTVDGVYDERQKTFTLTATQFTAPTQDQTEKDNLLIPLKTQLYSTDGQQLQLHNQTTGFIGDTELLILTDAKSSWVFTNIEQKPIIATNLDFSAPIILKTPNTAADLAVLARHCNNKFGKYDALQELYLNAYKNNLSNIKQGKAISFEPALFETYNYQLQVSLQDPEFAAELLAIPRAAYAFNFIENNDLNPLHLAQINNSLVTQLANSNSDLLRKIYLQIPVKPFAFTPEQYALRKLKAVVLQGIGYSGTNLELIQNQYDKADNLQDRLDAITVAINIKAEFTQQLVDNYIERYKDNSLVLDYYAQAVALSSSSTLEQVKHLDQLPGFNYEIPNRIYAAFLPLSNNFTLFHAEDGSGYHFHAQLIQKIDKFNPSVASRLCQQLLDFNKLDKKFSTQIAQQLLMISQHKISDNLSDPVNNGLKLARRLGLIE